MSKSAKHCTTALEIITNVGAWDQECICGACSIATRESTKLNMCLWIYVNSSIWTMRSHNFRVESHIHTRRTFCISKSMTKQWADACCRYLPSVQSFFTDCVTNFTSLASFSIQTPCLLPSKCWYNADWCRAREEVHSKGLQSALWGCQSVTC